MFIDLNYDYTLIISDLKEVKFMQIYEKVSITKTITSKIIIHNMNRI